MNVANLRGRFFLDTNVLVYSFDLTSPDKQRIAQGLIAESLRTQRGVISSQVVQELLQSRITQIRPPYEHSRRSRLPEKCAHTPLPSFPLDRLL